MIRASKMGGRLLDVLLDLGFTTRNPGASFSELRKALDQMWDEVLLEQINEAGSGNGMALLMEMRDEIAKLADDKESLVQTCADNIMRISSLEERLADARAKIEERQEKIGDLETRNIAMSKQIWNIQAKNTALEVLREMSTDEINELESKIASTVETAAAAPEYQSIGHQYRFADPMTGRAVWRDSHVLWNGQSPQGSREIFARDGGQNE